MQKFVIDVSEHQAWLDWDALKPNIDGAILRCGYGDDDADQDDKWWERNVSECERLGIPYGVYIYSYANSDAHAKSEIAHTLRLLKGHKPSYPVYLDLEEQSYGSYAKRCAELFCPAIEKAGYRAGVYTFESFYNSYMGGYKAYTLWIARYNSNDGKPHTKPSIGVSYDAWQYSSRARVNGYGGNLDVSYFYRDFPAEIGEPAKKAAQVELIDVANVAATIHADMCNDNANGYSWEPRWGEDGLGIKKLTIGGRTYQYDRGSYDCSSSVITACNEALRYTKYKNALKNATYTGDMLSVFIASGLFEKWNTASTIAQRGDVYLNYALHTAMCQTAEPDMLSEFSQNEVGGTHNGKVGDQTGQEAYIHAYYERPWNCTLHWKGKLEAADGKKTSTPAKKETKSTVNKPAKKTVDQLAQEVLDGKHGTGDARKKSLGSQYEAVQKRVNEILATPRPGTYKVLVDDLRVRNRASLSGLVMAHYDRGETVNLDSFKTVDGWIWGHYVSYTGHDRYIAVKSKDSKTVYAKRV